MVLNTNNGDLLNNKTNKILSRKIWIQPPVQDPEECARDDRIQEMINRPGRPRSRTLRHADHFTVFQGTVDNNDRESFHCAMGWILCAAQYFGILPLAGVRSKSPRKLAFKMYSPRTVYAVAIMVIPFIMALTCVYRIIQTLMTDTTGVDNHQTPRLRWKFSMLTATIMIAALLQYVMGFVLEAPREFWSSSSNMTVENALQLYCEKSHPQLSRLCNCNVAISISINFIIVVGTLMRNFTDLFIMLVSVGLAERYKSRNRRLKDTITTYRRNVDWLHFRESYAMLSTLVKTVDDDISPIILLSFVNNLYLICIYLFKGVSPSSDVLGTVAFMYFFALIIGRTIAVTLLAAEINDESRVALPYLYNCPGPVYNIETQRLQQQLSTDYVCLTRMGCFSINRNFLLAVFGTIVTYELMLLDAVSE